MTTLVITPIPQEFEALARAFQQRWGSPERREVGRSDVDEYRAADVILAEGGFGKVQFAVTTRHLLDHLPGVNLVVCAGVAGALTDSVRLGDVVVGTATVEHDFYSVVLRGVPPQFDGSGQHIAELVRNIGPDQGSFNVHFAPIASGDEAIVNAGRRGEVHASTEGLAVAYEGRGRSKGGGLLPHALCRGGGESPTWPMPTSLAILKPTPRTQWRTSPPWWSGWPNTPFPHKQLGERSEAEDDSPADAFVSMTLYPQKPIPARVRPLARTIGVPR